MAKLEETLAKGVENGNIPHAITACSSIPNSTALADDDLGSFTYSHAVGKAHFPDDKPIDDDAMFALASQTKLLTTIAALHVVEKGLFALDEDVSAKLPELAKQPVLTGFDDDDKPILEDRKGPITLRQLLTHSSGATYGMMHPRIMKYAEQQGRPTMGGATVVERFNDPLTYQPGESWMYSAGIDWAGKLVERLTDTTLDEYFKQLFAPLGVKNITFWPEKHALKDKILGIAARGSDGKLTNNTAPTLNTGSTDCFGGHGAYSTMGDYLKVLHSILANDGKLLTPETVKTMFQPQLPSDGKRDLMGFMASPGGQFVIGEWKPNLDLDWGLGGILLMQDDEGRRKKGTLSWGGMTNPFWLIDPAADLALTFGTQVFPPGDPGTKEMISAAEYAVYEMAGVKF
ncbi:hypothetical protein LTR56_015186 [Elasticomyces elasticus]|nr:hypothetical protein LTR56_015186 [Elasticomyces elasticus]KAK3644480.1 hypothetical protein LTR22_015200 [Elasticomyces elasticus]KAK4915517.1 hypothetical protein LTR49_016364 [Elasticomyces elasticus]KAK5756234.1 hypothetical protein LTS12_013658 [Elasticomyces elasticus]